MSRSAEKIVLASAMRFLYYRGMMHDFVAFRRRERDEEMARLLEVTADDGATDTTDSSEEGGDDEEEGGEAADVASSVHRPRGCPPAP